MWTTGPIRMATGIPDCVDFIPIPTTTTWGLVVLALLLLCAPQDPRACAPVPLGAILIKLAESSRPSSLPKLETRAVVARFLGATSLCHY